MDTKQKLLQDLQNAFAISLENIEKIVGCFNSEMTKGLAGETSSLQMIPTYVDRAKGTEKGGFIALDLGGTNFRILEVELEGDRVINEPIAEILVIEKKYIKGQGKRLFDFISDSLKTFMIKYKIDFDEATDIGFTFSFPVKQLKIDSGILVKWTKGFKAKGVEGKDVVLLMNESLARMGMKHVKVVAMANDTVGTLVAESYRDPDCDMGVIIGTGTNACYTEEIQNIKKLENHRKGQMIINIEWGNFDKLPLTLYDRELDAFSDNHGEQILEKMVSGMYLGKLTRLVIKDFINKKQIFEGKYADMFSKHDHFKTEYMSLIEKDDTENLEKTNTLLNEIGIPDSTLEDRKMLKQISSIIATRAARICATGMASVLIKMDPFLTKKHTIAIDGSVYEKYPDFSYKIIDTFKEFFRDKADNIKLVLSKDGSGKGSAVIAAVVRAKRRETEK